jgi:excisionase family DNA binding protein
LKEELYTVVEVAGQLRVSGDTVRRWLRSGELKGIPLGARAGYRISDADLRDFLERRKLAA